MDQALALANTIQNEFAFHRLPSDDAKQSAMHEFDLVKASEFMDTMEDIRRNARGYHPYLLAFIDGVLDGDDYNNNFGQQSSRERPRRAHDCERSRGYLFSGVVADLQEMDRLEVSLVHLHPAPLLAPE